MFKKFCKNISLLGLLVLFLSACHHEKPNVIYMPDMVYSPALKAQQEGVRLPVPGTISRDFIPYPYKNNPEGAGRELKNPLMPTRQVLVRGQHIFGIYCIACHGASGEGDGTIVPKFPRPPTLHSEKVRNWSDGRIFHTISVGQNLMPSYASQISAGDRWAAIYYVRVLQRAKHPTSEDLKIADEE